MSVHKGAIEVKSAFDPHFESCLVVCRTIRTLHLPPIGQDSLAQDLFARRRVLEGSGASGLIHGRRGGNPAHTGGGHEAPPG